MSTNTAITVSAPEGVPMPSAARLVGTWNAHYPEHAFCFDLDGQLDASAGWDLGMGVEPGRADFEYWSNGIDTEAIDAAARAITKRFPGVKVTYSGSHPDESESWTYIFSGGQMILATTEVPRTLLTTEQIIYAAIESFDQLDESEDMAVWAQNLAAAIDAGEVTA